VTAGRQLRPALSSFIVLTLLTGVVYPAILFGVAMIFPHQAEGSLVRRGGTIVGSTLIAQAFTRDAYFHPRPSAAGDGYDPTQSGGSNLAPNNPRLIEAVRQAAEAYRKQNALPPNAPIPVEAVTRSGSGLDPEISPQDARLQAARVAKARGVEVSTVLRLIFERTRGRDLGVLGEPRVSVLDLNLALDDRAPLKR
jgi:potassium-transporting ATPase KdpC subunit